MKLEMAKGTKDFGPEEKILRQSVAENLREIFERYGFSPIETPIIERLELLMAKEGVGQESDVIKEIFKFQDQGKRKLGLRFELTLSLARFIAMNPNLKMPFKRYEIGRVFRDGPIKLGRRREFWQCDVDVIGTSNMMSDAECVLLSLDVFDKLGLDAYLGISNRKILSGIIEFAGIKKTKEISVMITLDKLKKIGEEEVKKELKEKGISKEEISKLMYCLSISGTNEKKISALKEILNNKTGKEGLKELEEVFSYLNEEEKKRVIFNAGLARGLSYYTGTVFEGFLRKSKITSSICGGGRYDNLINVLVGKNVPAVGISFGLEPITEALKLRKGLKKCVTKVYVIPIKTEKESFNFVKELRKNNIKADIDLIGRGISKNLDYANKNGIPFVVIIGQKELNENKFRLKDMKTGKECLVNKKDLIKKIRV